MIGTGPGQTFELTLREGVSFPCRFMTQREVRQRRILQLEAEAAEREGNPLLADEKFKAAMMVAFGGFSDAVIAALADVTPFEAVSFIDSIDHKQFMSEMDKKKSASPSASALESSAPSAAMGTATQTTGSST